MAIVYIDEEAGNDAPPADTQAHGTTDFPFKSLGQAYLTNGSGHEYQVKKDEDGYKPAAKAAVKKAMKFASIQEKKREAADKRAQQEASEKAELDQVLERAKAITISPDPSLPEAVLIGLDETDPSIIGQLRKEDMQQPDKRTVRVRVQGRVHRVAKQGNLMFVVLRRGLDYMQCLLSGNLAKSYDALTLARETAMEVFGELWEVPPGARAPLNRELHADYFTIIAKAPGGDEAFVTLVPEDGEQKPNLRHLALRWDKPTSVMFVRSVLESAFRAVYKDLKITHVSPPALVQTQVEGGATLFGLKYYGETAYLTQSSQLYLETALPSLGDVYCIEKSFRAEKSLTRRHVCICLSTRPSSLINPSFQSTRT
jgi:asparaginyl-tRNA synthetase